MLPQVFLYKVVLFIICLVIYVQWIDESSAMVSLQKRADVTQGMIQGHNTDCIPEQIPYSMKIYTEFNLAPWLRLVKFTELNISKL